MLTYEKCKEIASNRAADYGTEITKSYTIGSDFVFDADEQYPGVFPFVVCADSGEISGLWPYLIKKDMTMDDMQEIA